MEWSGRGSFVDGSFEVIEMYIPAEDVAFIALWSVVAWLWICRRFGGVDG